MSLTLPMNISPLDRAAPTLISSGLQFGGILVPDPLLSQSTGASRLSL
jgi:hypothetical protein